MTDLPTPEPGPVGDRSLPDAPERPRTARPSPREWARTNLFSTGYNSLLTVVLGSLLGFGAFRGLRFVFATARWEIIDRNLTNLVVWLWPHRPGLTRPWVALFIAALTIGLVIGRAARAEAVRRAEDPAHPQLPSLRASAGSLLRRVWPLLLLLVALGWFSGSPLTIGLMLLLVAVALVGRTVGLRQRGGSRTTLGIALIGGLAAYGTLVWFGGAGWNQWGGLMLTVFLAVGGIVLSFPFGVAFALGRRSDLPVVRWFSVAYIELFRGVPLITLLIMGDLMLPLFLPPTLSDVAKVTRGIAAITIFTAAYIAEIVRGGLQSVPGGQVEAAQALGLSPFKQTRLIVLPQALRNVIPATVGQFISLFKDTSLFAIIGGFELLRVSRIITSQGDFAGRGLLAETLAFAAFVYWVIAYTMSRESQRLERRLGVGER